MRKLIPLLASVAALALLTACNPSSTTSSAKVQQVATDVADIAAVVAADAPQLKTLAGVNAATITDTATAVQTAAAAIAQQGPTASTVQALGAAINAMLAAAEADPQLPQGLQSDLTAAQVLVTGAEIVLPIISDVAGAAPVLAPTPQQMDSARIRIVARMRQ